MRPLALWLNESSGPSVPQLSCSEPEEHQVVSANIINEVSGEYNAFTREEELLAALRRVEIQLEECKRANTEKESQLRQQLGQELTDRLILEFDVALGELRQTIEDTLCQVLLPFLSDQARIRAVSNLFDLMRDELKRVDLPVIEIRAPVELHSALEKLSEYKEIAVTLTAADAIEIVYATHRSRFEELSSEWRMSIGEAEI